MPFGKRGDVREARADYSTFRLLIEDAPKTEILSLDLYLLTVVSTSVQTDM